MNINTHKSNPKLQRRELATRAIAQDNAAPPRDSFQPSDETNSSFGPRVLGAFVGALVGGIGGATGSQGAAAVSGLSAGVATAATLGPSLVGTVKEGLNGDPINDIALTSSAVFAGGVTLSAFSAAAGLGAYALDQALPGSGRLVGAALGAVAGYHVGIWN